MTGLSNAATITFAPFDPIVLQGDTFAISIVGQGFSETVGGDVQVEWDANLLSLTNVDLSVWPGDTVGSTPGANFVSLSVGNFAGTNPSGDFVIAALTFLASDTNTGISPFTFGVSFWSDANFGQFDPQPNSVNGQITVNAIPIPPTIMLLGGGLIGLIALRRRRA